MREVEPTSQHGQTTYAVNIGKPKEMETWLLLELLIICCDRHCHLITEKNQNGYGEPYNFSAIWTILPV